MSLCYVSCSTLCLNNLFILNLFYITGVYTTVSKKKRWNLQENLIHTNFTFQQRDFKLLVMPFILLSTKITSKIIINHKNKINQKKSVLQTAAIRVQLFYLPTSYFCLQCLTRFDGFKSHFSNTKGSRQPITGKRNPRPKPSQLRMALHMPDSTRGVSHCLMEHCQIINLHEFTL